MLVYTKFTCFFANAFSESNWKVQDKWKQPGNASGDAIVIFKPLLFALFFLLGRAACLTFVGHHVVGNDPMQSASSIFGKDKCSQLCGVI